MDGNWTLEAVRAELDYRRGDVKEREQRREFMRAHPSWWQRVWAQRAAHDGAHDVNGRRAAA